MGSIIGHRVDYNGVGALRAHTQQKSPLLCFFLLGTWNLYLREIIFVSDVAVLTIETIRLVFKLLFLKQFHFLKPLDIFMTLLKYAMRFWNKYYISIAHCVFQKRKKNVALRNAKEDVDKVCIRLQKHAVSHLNTKHLVLWTMPKTLEPQWRNRLKERQIRSGLRSRKVELSHVNKTFIPLSAL